MFVVVCRLAHGACLLLDVCRVLLVVCCLFVVLCCVLRGVWHLMFDAACQLLCIVC